MNAKQVADILRFLMFLLFGVLVCSFLPLPPTPKSIIIAVMLISFFSAGRKTWWESPFVLSLAGCWGLFYQNILTTKSDAFFFLVGCIALSLVVSILTRKFVIKF